jgi:hypothetical protein
MVALAVVALSAEDLGGRVESEVAAGGADILRHRHGEE